MNISLLEARFFFENKGGGGGGGGGGVGVGVYFGPMISNVNDILSTNPGKFQFLK